MTTEYLEKYEIPGDCFYGIEGPRKEVKQSGKFPFTYTPEVKRYQVWRGGCGIGQVSTLKEARQRIHRFAITRMAEDRDALLKKAALIDEHYQRLIQKGVLDPSTIQQYKVMWYDFERAEEFSKALTS